VKRRRIRAANWYLSFDDFIFGSWDLGDRDFEIVKGMIRSLAERANTGRDALRIASRF
jgi:hypothetical protein